MNALNDPVLIVGLILGYIGGGVLCSIVLARIALAARDWLNRNAR